MQERNQNKIFYYNIVYVKLPLKIYNIVIKKSRGGSQDINRYDDVDKLFRGLSSMGLNH